MEHLIFSSVNTVFSAVNMHISFVVHVVFSDMEYRMFYSMRICLILLVSLSWLVANAQTNKVPYGVTRITTSGGTKLAPVPDESAVQYNFDFSVEKSQMQFLLELKEYKDGEYVTNMLGDDILRGIVNRDSPVKFRVFLDFSNPKRFCLYTYTGASMWLKSRDCERPLKYVEYQRTGMGKAGLHPLFLIYEDDDKGETEKMLKGLLMDGKLPVRYTPDALGIKKFSRVLFVYYQLN